MLMLNVDWLQLSDKSDPYSCGALYWLLTCTQLESEGDGSQKLQVHKAQRERAKVMDKKYIINLTEECIEKKIL